MFTFYYNIFIGILQPDTRIVMFLWDNDLYNTGASDKRINNINIIYLHVFLYYILYYIVFQTLQDEKFLILCHTFFFYHHLFPLYFIHCFTFLITYIDLSNQIHQFTKLSSLTIIELLLYVLQRSS